VGKTAGYARRIKHSLLGDRAILKRNKDEIHTWRCFPSRCVIMFSFSLEKISSNLVGAITGRGESFRALRDRFSRLFN